jgi:hypothetical protein
LGAERGCEGEQQEGGDGKGGQSESSQRSGSLGRRCLVPSVEQKNSDQWSVVSGQCRGQGSGVRFQVSGIRDQGSGVRFQGSVVRFQVSGIRAWGWTA